MNPRILVIDDESNYLVILRELLSRDGFEVDGVNEPLEGLKLAARRAFDAALVDRDHRAWLVETAGLRADARTVDLHAVAAEPRERSWPRRHASRAIVHDARRCREVDPPVVLLEHARERGPQRLRAH